MKFGLFGSAQAKRGGPDIDSAQGFKDFVEYNVEAEALPDIAESFDIEAVPSFVVLRVSPHCSPARRSS